MGYVKTAWVDNVVPPGIDAEHLNKIEAGIFDVTEESAANVSDITALDGRLDTVETNLGTAQSDITELDGRLDTAETNIGTAQSDIDNLKNFHNESFITNGFMDVSQIGTSKSGVTTNDILIDRFPIKLNSIGTYTYTQELYSDFAYMPFSYFLKSLCTGTGTLIASSAHYISHRLQYSHGFDNGFLRYGTADAKTINLYFYVMSNVTGTHIVEVINNDINNGEIGPSISKSFTINAADTWELKSITIPGYPTPDPSTGDNQVFNLDIRWWLSAGSDFQTGTLNTSWGTPGANRATGQVGHYTANDYFCTTGILAYAGDDAGYLQRKPPQVEFEDCLKHCFKTSSVNTIAVANGATQVMSGREFFPTNMVSTPTLTFDNISLSTGLGTLTEATISSGDTHSFNIVATVTGATLGAVNFITYDYLANVDQLAYL